MSFGEIVTWPFAKLMVWLYNLTGNYGLALTFFALAVNLIMTPFMAKSKKSMMRSSRLQPKIQELQRRHEGNPQKLNAEMQKLYQEEGISPMSGCLWSLIPFPILIALYSVVRQPLTRMMFVAKDFVTVLQDYFVGKGLYEAAAGRASAYQEIELAKLMPVAKAFEPLTEDWIKEKFGDSLWEGIKEENKNDILSSFDPQIIVDNWDKIREIIAEIPPAEELESLYKAVGSKYLPAVSVYKGSPNLPLSI